jgi:hypothetical protein
MSIEEKGIEKRKENTGYFKNWVNNFGSLGNVSIQ